LAAVLWSLHLVFAAAAALPLGRFLFGALGHAPEGDRLLDGMTLDLLAILSRQAGGFSALLGAGLATALLLVLLGNALASGGVLESLTSADPRPFLHRFGRGAGRFFWRFLKMGLVALPTAAAAAALLGGPLLFWRRRLEESGPETTRILLGLLGLLLAVLAAATVTMALDLARIRVVREDHRRPIRLFLRCLGTTLRHPVRLLGLWLVNTVAFAALLALYAALGSLLPVATLAGIAALVVLQQLAMFGRAALRVALWAGELGVAEDLARLHRWGTAPPPAPRIQALPPAPAPDPVLAG
jgi:hypothetical protein